jgi:hypothetical protein
MTNPGPIQHVRDRDHVFGAHAPGYDAAAVIMRYTRPVEYRGQRERVAGE